MVAATITALAAASLMLAARHAAAQTAPATTVATAFNIPAQPLAQALAEFARLSGLQLAYTPDLVQGKSSAAVIDRKDVPTALADLLRGTGLQARQAGGTWAIERAPVVGSSVETVLPVVRVSASQERETATGPVVGYVAKRSSTGSKTDTPTREVPQSITVVTRDSIEARGVSSLAEALEYAPGFTALTYGHDDRYDWSIARGIGATTQSNYRDGMKADHSIYAVPRLNTYGAERVEFLRGPASLLFGSNTPGGIVNSITKRPTPESRGEVRLRTDPSVVGQQNGLVPRQKFTAWLDWRLASVVQGLSLGLGVRHNSKVPNHDNTRWVPGVTLADARLSYRLNDWEFALNARNLFDKQHLVNCSYGDCYPGDRREAIATANYRW